MTIAPDVRYRAGMDRRRFLLTSLAGVLAVPLVAETQPSREVHRIGYLGNSVTASQSRVEAFRRGLRELGWVEGQNIVIEPRVAGGEVSGA